MWIKMQQLARFNVAFASIIVITIINIMLNRTTQNKTKNGK